MKKLLMLVAILVVVSWSSLPLSGLLIKQGFEHREKKWAPDAVLTGARIQVYMLKYATARPTLEQMLLVFPRYAGTDRVFFYIGLCFEKERNYKKAREWYQRFVQVYPNHPWTSQVQRRDANLEVSQ